MPLLPILYSFRRCPYAMRARLALVAAGQTCQLREVVLRDKPAAMLAASPKGTVPVLVLPDGSVIEQSLEIMLWALHLHDPNRHLEPEREDLPAMLALIDACEQTFKFHLDRYKYPQRYQLHDGLIHRDRAALWLEQLEYRLACGAFLFGARWTLGDMAIVPFVRQFAHTDMAWFETRPWPKLLQWLQAWEASPAYARIMGKFPPWEQGQPAILFPAPLA